MSTSTQQTQTRKTIFKLTALTIGMFAFGFALVPLYSVICKKTGLNGKIIGPGVYDSGEEVDKSRTITIQFLASTNAYLPWEFRPLQKSIQMHPGEMKRIAFYAKNNSGRKMTVQAVPSVSPGLAAQYIRKTECFCFTRQTFNAGEAQDMPVLFQLDKELPKNVNTITLSYTMFDADKFTNRPTKEAGRIH